MKLNRFTPLLLIALALIAGIASSSLAEPDKAPAHAVIVAGGEPLSFDLDDLELGESQQLTTDSGKVVTVTRDDQGYLINVDGKDIRLGELHSGAHVKVVTSDGNDDDTRVWVHNLVREVRVEPHGEALKVDAEGLAVGESRQLTTDSGKVVTVTREEKGLKLEVDGKVIQLPGDDEDLHLEAGDQQVRVLKLHHGQGTDGKWKTEDGEVVDLGEGHGFHFISAEDGPGHVVVQGCEDGDDCQVHVMKLGGDGQDVEVEVNGEHKVIFLRDGGEVGSGTGDEDVKVWVDGGDRRVIVIDRREIKKEDGDGDGKP